MIIKQVKNINNDYIDFCYELLRNSFPFSISPYLIYNDNAYRDYFSRLIYEKDHFIYIVIKQDQLLGFAHFRILNKQLFLNNIIINSNFRSEGMGRILFEYACNNITEKNKEITSISLDVFESNVIAHKWYCKLGFQIMSKSYWFDIRYKLSYSAAENQKIMLKNDENGFNGFYVDERKIASLINYQSLIFHDLGLFQNYKTYFSRKKYQNAVLVSNKNIASFKLIDTALRMKMPISQLSSN